ncbi:rod shape-determining protein MreC [Croceitalea rosinachiae]|uniref:Cell shape-determining protein MreC n=1 Tax=Croceitalea rosinachiae TaxID=3075596 RepID=A0ABU3ACC8_9FLAO|nr:rod shape-determining protein MreC [Croceitalea sp. F388]MDT0606763.1 rod shape-determining protein MreC [Croceitalea sp. F388]
MQRIINFILNYRNAFLYVFLLLISLVLTVRSHSFHQSKFFNSSKWLTGSLYQTSSNITSYFDLREENDRLAKENERLRFQLLNADANLNSSDTLNVNFEVVNARITKNSYASPRNYLTIDKGEKAGIKQDMGVITTKGILGIVENTSTNFATVQSILNMKSNINAKIKNTNYFGSLIWDAKKYDIVQLTDIPRLVPVTVGDTIVTGAMSSIFPENIPIGVIKNFSLNEAQSFYNIDINLFNDMANIKNIYIIKNKNREEIINLEERILNAQ